VQVRLVHVDALPGERVEHAREVLGAIGRGGADAAGPRVDDYTIGHVFRRFRFAEGERPTMTPEDRERIRDLLATGEFPLLAAAYAPDSDLAPPDDTFDRGLEWLFDGMEASLRARRG
jgi:tetracycline repressor-like protein